MSKVKKNDEAEFTTEDSEIDLEETRDEDEGKTFTPQRKKILIYVVLGIVFMLLISSVGIGRVLAFFNVRSFVLLIMSVAGAISTIFMIYRIILYFVNKKK